MSNDKHVNLKRELEFFESQKEELLKHHEGKYALIIGEELLGTFDSSAKAYASGISARGNVPMLIKRIERDETPGSIPSLTLGLLHAGI